MIHCRPLGICSWDFELRGEGHVVRLGFGWPTEQGWINIDGHSYDVVKQGFFSGRWELVDGGRVELGAKKRSAFTRGFDLSTPSGSFALEASSFAGRTMGLYGPGVDVSIRPAHAFTRRASIEGRLPDIEVVVFAFWLTALTWRRAANNSNAGGN